MLFGLSGNQCAYPGCKNNVIELATEYSDALIIGQICHIHAISSDGPRGSTSLSISERNSYENLILLCPTHHVKVDGQYETYPPEMLKQWKQAHVTKQFSTDIDSIQSIINPHTSFTIELIDQHIRNETNILRKSRFFQEFDRTQKTLILARKVAEGEYSGGSDLTRCQALAWYVRFLSRTEELNKAEEYLKLSKKLGACPEIQIADAFILSQKGNKVAALRTLASIDSLTSRSAALMVFAHHDGPKKAIDWVKTAGMDASSLSPDGKFFYLQCQLEVSDLEIATDILDVLTEDDTSDTPILHYMIAMTHLLSTVPHEFRTVVFKQIPFGTANFPLDSDAAAIKARRTAEHHFTDMANIARQLNCPEMAKLSDEYSLWLQLRDPDISREGRKNLESKFHDLKSGLRFVPLGLQFGVNLNLEAVNNEIERQIAINGGITFDAALARFALAFVHESSGDVANYISKHYDELVNYIDKKSIQYLQIEMLSRAGRPKQANKCLETLIEDGLSEVEENRLRGIISETSGTDPVETSKEQFGISNSLYDLIHLVDALEEKQEWDELCKYSQILFEKTGSLKDMERLARALTEAQRYYRLLELLKTKKPFIAQSKMLQMVFCWSLYYEGALLEARSELNNLDNDQDDPNFRKLQMYLAISLGDWNSLSEFVESEFSNRDKRTAKDLIEAAQIAFHLGLPRSKELIFSAADKGNNDAFVLAVAYFLAIKAGLENNQEISQWLQKSVSLSDKSGPIRMMTLRDIVDQKPNWERQESEIWKQLYCGDIPMFVAAQTLNKSLSHFILFPAFMNPLERDPRHRGIIPAYSGQHHPRVLNTSGQIGIDASALLTLSSLNLLGEALDACDTVFIPHSTLGWLLCEKHKVSFHQPVLIRIAHKISHLINMGVIEKLSSTAVPDSFLSDQVGEELSQLIVEAEKVAEERNVQAIVVQSYPVYRVASLMEEEADLTAYTSVLSSFQSVVDKLQEKGQITADERKQAQVYLQLHEKPWPNQPEIDDGAILYLDSLAITYFQHLGLLEKLNSAGFKLFISPRKVSQINELISYESISEKVLETIEDIRSAVNSRIESGKIRVGRLTIINQSEDQSILEGPFTGIFDFPSECCAIISDDRFLNQYPNFQNDNAGDDRGRLVPIFLTLDLLELLASTGSITADDLLEYKTRLRQAGYIFVPVSEKELAHHLDASSVKDNKINETAELKAIRENILRVRMSSWFQFPQEVPWLNSVFVAFLKVLNSLWHANAELTSTRVKSDWIITQIDMRTWAHLFHGNADEINMASIGAPIRLMFKPPVEATREIKDEYWNWLEQSVLVPIKEHVPDLYSWIVESQKKDITDLANMDMTEEKEI